jgi:hypothetical protein
MVSPANMGHTSKPSGSRRRALGLVPVLIMLTSGALAQPDTLSVFTTRQAELHQYLDRKYLIERIDIQSREHRLWGQTRNLWMKGALTPPLAAGLAARTASEARHIAQAFFSEEATLLGLTPISEMREKIRPGDPTDERGNTHLRYHHYLGGVRLEGTETLIHIRANGAISSITAGIAPISPELLTALTQPTLPEPEIRLVIKRDLQASGLDPRRVTHLELEKVAIGASPYVLWKARVGDFACEYTMNAFSGQILEKMSTIRFFRAPTPEESATIGCRLAAHQ